MTGGEPTDPPRRVLVADDKSRRAQVRTILLRRAGQDARTAFGGEHAVEVADACSGRT